MTIAASLRALLGRSIDYAGLFPPASLELNPALTNQASYVRSNENWMLNAFVLPVGQFSAAKQFLSPFDSAYRLFVSALGPKTENASAFRKALGDVAAGIEALTALESARVSVGQLEMFMPGDVDFDLLNEASSRLGNLPAFWEAPSKDAERTIALLNEYNARRGTGSVFGYKMRTGGVTADAFPQPSEIARGLVASANQGTPIKFTAGLHHPLRQHRDEVQTKMHGFLNVLGAAVLAREHKWDVDHTTEMLEDEQASSFQFTDEFFGWRDWKIEVGRLRERRKFVTTFGSCSFDEPREDLRTLRLL